MEDINLDFLKSPPKSSRSAERCPSPYVYNDIDVRFGKKKHGNKKLEMALSIAKADELLREIDRLKNQNNELQSQLKDFQKTAQEIRVLYNKEKQRHETLKESFNNLNKEYEKIDADLINKTMVNDQMKARLAEYEGRPVNFNALVVKYVKLMNKLEGEDVLKYSGDKDLLETLKDYCSNMKLKISSNNSPKKNKTKDCKIKKQEACVQCNLYEESKKLTGIFTPSIQAHNFSKVASAVQCSLHEENVTKKCITKNQTTQCFNLKRDQASQYISTMITRQTNTEKVIQKHVQTMFPEPQTMPAIDDILNTYSKWSHIRSVSPLRESPQRVGTQKKLKGFKTSGTCTMLCNIRRRIDYLPPNITNIKQEIVTPSASPTPNSQRVVTNRQFNTTLPNIAVNTNNQNQLHSIFNLLNTSANTSTLGQFSSNAFNELWQIFGKMLLNLLQTSNAGIANSHPNSAINQQQFFDWLMDLYVSSQPQTTISAETQTAEQPGIVNNILIQLISLLKFSFQIDNLTSASPVSFNSSSSFLDGNIVRPQAQKSMPVRASNREGIYQYNYVFLKSNPKIMLHFQIQIPPTLLINASTLISL